MASTAVLLLLGGVITDWAGWRWIFFVDVPIAAVVAITAPLVLPESRDAVSAGSMSPAR